MNHNSPPQNYNNNQKINSILKKIIIFFGIGILGLTLLLISLYMNKKSPKAENAPVIKEAHSRNAAFNSNCSNKEIIYKENYIAIDSKTCKQIKIIVPQSNKINIIDY